HILALFVQIESLRIVPDGEGGTDGLCSAKELHHGIDARVLLSLVLLGLEIQLIPLSKPVCAGRECCGDERGTDLHVRREAAGSRESWKVSSLEGRFVTQVRTGEWVK